MYFQASPGVYKPYTPSVQSQEVKGEPEEDPGPSARLPTKRSHSQAYFDPELSSKRPKSAVYTPQRPRAPEKKKYIILPGFLKTSDGRFVYAASAAGVKNERFDIPPGFLCDDTGLFMSDSGEDEDLPHHQP